MNYRAILTNKRIKNTIVLVSFVVAAIFLQNWAFGAVEDASTSTEVYGEQTTINDTYGNSSVSDSTYNQQPSTHDEVYSTQEEVYVMEAVYGQIAVTKSYWDDMGKILTKMHYPYTTIPEQDLTDYDKLKDYDIVLINNSAFAEKNAEAASDSIKQYVKKGGTLLVSDYAVAYVKKAFPGYLNFSEHSRIGQNGDIEAEMVDSALGEQFKFISASKNISLKYPLQSWEVIESIDRNTEVLLQGSYEVYKSKRKQKPLAVRFKHGKGQVIYTTFTFTMQDIDVAEKIMRTFISY